MMTLKKLLSEAYPELSVARSVPDLPVLGLECDSRKVGKDFVFVAIPGVKADGNAFIREALTRGAVAVVGERTVPAESGDDTLFLAVPEARVAMARLAAAFYGYPARSLKAVGITGTNGKTTTSYILEHILSAAGRKAGVLGTVNYRFGGQEIPAVETTPGPLKAQEILARMVRGGCEFAVMEVSSHALHQKRVEGIDFAAALFTNLTRDHLDYHGSIEAYFECKASLFSRLAPGAHAVLNADDDWGRRIVRSAHSNVLTYAVDREADFRAINLSAEAGGTAFDLSFRGKNFSVKLPLVGTHNVYNALGAVGLAHALGLDAGAAAASLESFAGVPGRLERVDRGQAFSVFVDFAHTPDGLDNVLRSLLPYKKGKFILVFGCGGDRDRGKRPEMARVASVYCDQVIVTSDNPRSEDPRGIVKEICAGFPAEFEAHTAVVDRRKAIRLALLSAREGDIVLLAGKGHERTQIIGAETLPFSDREEAERVLDGR